MQHGKSSSLNNNLAVDRLAHNPKVGRSNPPPQPTFSITSRPSNFDRDNPRRFGCDVRDFGRVTDGETVLGNCPISVSVFVSVQGNTGKLRRSYFATTCSVLHS